MKINSKWCVIEIERRRATETSAVRVVADWSGTQRPQTGPPGF